MFRDLILDFSMSDKTVPCPEGMLSVPQHRRTVGPNLGVEKKMSQYMNEHSGFPLKNREP